MVLVVWFILRTGSCCSFRYLFFIINWSDTSTFYWYNLFHPDILWTTMIRFLFQLSTFWGLKLPSYWHSTPKTVVPEQRALVTKKITSAGHLGWTESYNTLQTVPAFGGHRPLVKIICWRAITTRLFFYSDVTKIADQVLPTSVPLQRSIRQLSRNKTALGELWNLNFRNIVGKRWEYLMTKEITVSFCLCHCTS